MFLFLGCEKDEEIPDIYFPVGRISVLNDNITVKKNNMEVIHELVYDNCGGYVLKFDASLFAENDDLIINFSRTDQPTEDFKDTTHLEIWLGASHYNDCDNDTIISKALEITAGLNTNSEKAIAIHQFILKNLEFNTGYYDRAGLIVSSQFLEDGIIGICINFSRLFVSLCRAAGVPARTVWGVVYGSTDDGVYNYHHQWAEFCDEDGIWHACDFTYRTDFFNNDMRYIDLIYGAEEYSTITGNTEWMSRFKNVRLTEDGYPVLIGDFGFELIADNRPDSMIVEYVIQF